MPRPKKYPTAASTEDVPQRVARPFPLDVGATTPCWQALTTPTSSATAKSSRRQACLAMASPTPEALRFVDTVMADLIADRVWHAHTSLDLAVVEYLGAKAGSFASASALAPTATKRRPDPPSILQMPA